MPRELLDRSDPVFEPDFQRISAVEDTYRGISRELTLEDWMKRPMGVKYVDNVARLTATLQ